MDTSSSSKTPDVVGETPTHRLISVQEVATILNVSPRTVWRLLSAGRIVEPIRLGAVVRWRADEVHRWIDAGCPAIKPHKPK